MGSTHGPGGGSTYSDGQREAEDTGPSGQTISQIVQGRDEVEESYDEHVEDSRITELQGETISERRDVLVEILDDDLDVEDSQLIGSFTRDTMVEPLDRDSDADVMIVLNADSHREWVEQENGPQNCLRAVKRRIENDPRFSDTEVRIRQNVVQVRYHDSTVEIAPAFRYREVPHAEHPTDGFNLFNDASDGYAIPDTHGQQSWQGTNPRRYKQQFEARDQAHNGKVSGLARTAKKWSENNDVPVRSYHMEVMVYNYFERKAKTGEPVPDSYEELTRDFMKSLPSKVRTGTQEPIYGESVDKGMSRRERRKAAEKASDAAEKLEEAKRLKEQGKTEQAKQKLREVHGEGFN
jgi:hypothetical protein